MSKLTKSVLTMLCVAVLAAPNTLADCNRKGFCRAFGSCQFYYDYAANGDFNSSCAWSYVNATRKTDGAICGGGLFSSYAQMTPGPPTGTAKVYQLIYVPREGEPGYVSSSTRWSVGWNSQLYDPSMSQYVTFTVYVFNNDTGQVIANGPPTSGWQGDPSCRADSFTFIADLNGVNVRLEVRGTLRVTGSFINITNLQFTQNTRG